MQRDKLTREQALAIIHKAKEDQEADRILLDWKKSRFMVSRFEQLPKRSTVEINGEVFLLPNK